MPQQIAGGIMAVGGQIESDIANVRVGRAEQRAVQEAQGRQRNTRAMAVALAQASERELKALDNNIKLYENGLDRTMQLVDRGLALSKAQQPGAEAAAQQIYNTLQGQVSGIEGALRTRLERQEAQLRSRIRAQTGAAPEETTAGQQALQAFQESSNLQLEQARQQNINTLGGVIGVQQQGLQSTGSTLGFNLQTLGSIMGRNIQAEQNIQSRIVNAFLGSSVDEFAEVGFVDPYGRALGRHGEASKKMGSSLASFGMANGGGGGGGSVGGGGGGNYNFYEGSTIPANQSFEDFWAGGKP